jgi:hypothetical protein
MIRGHCWNILQQQEPRLLLENIVMQQWEPRSLLGHIVTTKGTRDRCWLITVTSDHIIAAVALDSIVAFIIPFEYE